MTHFSFSDHNLVTRCHHHKSRKWYVTTVFCRAISWGVANATVIYREFNPKFKNCEAKELLADELATWLFPHCDSDNATATPFVDEEQPRLISPQEPSVPPDVPVWCGHYATPASLAPTWCQAHHGRPSEGRPCVAHIQKKKVDTFCLNCGKFLCVKDGCFKNFHSFREYLMDDPRLINAERRKKFKVW